MYQFQVEYDFECFSVLSRVYEKTFGRKQKILQIFLGVVFANIIVALLFFFFGMLRYETAWMYLLVTVLGVIVFIRQLPDANARASQRSSMDAGENTFILNETGVQVHNLKEETHYWWNSFLGGYHCREYYILFLDEKRGIILPERSLVQGDHAALKAFLEENLQKEIQEIR